MALENFLENTELLKTVLYDTPIDEINFTVSDYIVRGSNVGAKPVVILKLKDIEHTKRVLEGLKHVFPATFWQKFFTHPDFTFYIHINSIRITKQYNCISEQYLDNHLIFLADTLLIALLSIQPLRPVELNATATSSTALNDTVLKDTDCLALEISDKVLSILKFFTKDRSKIPSETIIKQHCNDLRNKLEEAYLKNAAHELSMPGSTSNIACRKT